MTYDDIVQFFGSPSKAQRALALKSRQTLANWRRDGVPVGQQCRIQIITNGKLTADEQVTAMPGEREEACIT